MRVGKSSHFAPLTAILHFYLIFEAIYGRGDMCLGSSSNIVLYAGPCALFSFLFLIIFTIGVLTSKENQQTFHRF
jgi:hypothetical protein